MDMNSRREEDDEVELKVDVRQPSTFGRIVDMQAHSNHCLLSHFPPPPNPDCSASERQKSLESHAIVGPEPIRIPESTTPQEAVSNAKPRMSSRHSKDRQERETLLR